MINTKTENTIERLFELAIELEYQTADIYKKFAKLFSHVPGLPAFWQGLHDDEIQHVVTLQNIRKSLKPEQLLVCTPTEIWDSVIRNQRIIRKDPLDSITTLNDAYELAHELESFEVNTIFSFLALNIIPPGMPEDNNYLKILKHQQKLMDFCRFFGDRKWRKEIKVQCA